MLLTSFIINQCDRKLTPDSVELMDERQSAVQIVQCVSQQHNRQRTERDREIIDNMYVPSK